MEFFHVNFELRMLYVNVELEGQVDYKEGEEDLSDDPEVKAQRRHEENKYAATRTTIVDHVDHL